MSKLNHFSLEPTLSRYQKPYTCRRRTTSAAADRFAILDGAGRAILQFDQSESREVFFEINAPNSQNCRIARPEPSIRHPAAAQAREAGESV